MGDFPLAEHPAEFFRRPIDERLLFRRQFEIRDVQQLPPVRIAGKQFALPSDRAGFHGVFFRVGQLGQHFPVLLQERAADVFLADHGHIEGDQHGCQHQRREHERHDPGAAAGRESQKDQAECRRPNQQPGAKERAGERHSKKSDHH